MKRLLFFQLLLFFALTFCNRSYAQPNIALTATATQSGGGVTIYGPANYNDNIISTYTTCGGSCPTPWGWVSTTNASSPNWIEYTWTTPQNVNKVVFFISDRPATGATIQYWDGSAYVNIVTATNFSCPLDSVMFNPVTTTKLRFYNITSTSSNPNFREIQVYGPTIEFSQQPSNAIVCSSDDTSFTVVTVNPVIAYQWQYNDGNGWSNVPATAPYSGVTTNTLTVTNALPSLNNYQYRCAVSDTQFTVNSNVASLTVYSAPNGAITHSSPLDFCEGSAVTLNIFSATGYTYQWYKDSVAIPGATSTYYFTGLPGDYYVAMNVAGCTGSTPTVTVTINPAPLPVITRSGDTLSTASYPTYQWYYNQQPIAGATSQRYITTIDGPYNVSVRDTTDCIGLSNVFYMSHLNVANYNSTAKVSVYPNPSTDKVNISSSTVVNVVVRNLQGQVVIDQKNAKDISIRNLAVGIYMMVISDNNGKLIKMEKLVKY